MNQKCAIFSYYEKHTRLEITFYSKNTYNSRPIPDILNPPNGAAGLSTL